MDACFIFFSSSLPLHFVVVSLLAISLTEREKKNTEQMQSSIKPFYFYFCSCSASAAMHFSHCEKEEKKIKRNCIFYISYIIRVFNNNNNLFLFHYFVPSYVGIYNTQTKAHLRVCFVVLPVCHITLPILYYFYCIAINKHYACFFLLRFFHLLVPCFPGPLSLPLPLYIFFLFFYLSKTKYDAYMH